MSEIIGRMGKRAQLMISSRIGHVVPGSQLSGYPTIQELTPPFAVKSSDRYTLFAVNFGN
jgi:hypothetical protein